MPSVPAPKLLKMLFLSSSVVNELPSEVFSQPGAAVGAGAEGGGGLEGVEVGKGGRAGLGLLRTLCSPGGCRLSPLGGAAGPGTGYL